MPTLYKWRSLVSLPLSGHTNRMSSPAVASAASATLDSLLSQPLGGMRGMERPATCCCGREQCAYLEHNEAAIEGLEKDLQSAAQIGQVSAHFGCQSNLWHSRISLVPTVLRHFCATFLSTTCTVYKNCLHSHLRATCPEVLGPRFTRWSQTCR